MFELSIRMRSLSAYVRFGSEGVSMIDWDEEAKKKQEARSHADRQRQLDEQRSADFWREVPAFTTALVKRFTAEAERFNAKKATEGEKIEITCNEHGTELRRLAPPTGYLAVTVIRGSDSADIKCVVAGNTF